MDWAFFVIFQVLFRPCLSVLFTVETERNTYQSECGGDVVMGCRFQPTPLNPGADLQVTWHRIGTGSDREVYMINNGRERPPSQEYQGRVQLLADELMGGWAKLKLSRLRVSDSGTYQCLVNTAEGADYKTITLAVVAPYKEVIKRVEKTADGDAVTLTCQSEGYPISTVEWHDGRRHRLAPNTTAVSTADQLFRVTSRIRVGSSDPNNYTCSFTNDRHSATFHIPDEIPIPPVKSDPLIAVLSIGVVALVCIAALICYRRKGSSSGPGTRNHGFKGPGRLHCCLQRNKENEEEIIDFNAALREENLGEFVKRHYSNVMGKEMRSSRGAFSLEEPPHRLQNKEGQDVNLQALIPEAGETLLLEGPPGSGKTTVAQVLVSSWTEGRTDLLDLSALRLLLHVDCSVAKGDLFQEVVTQLSGSEKMLTAAELRTALSGSGRALLLLDGYREGNLAFDASLRRFLGERGQCGVLVTACPGHCPSLEEAHGTGGVLKLQRQIVKY